MKKHLSEPAKSTNESLPRVTACVCRFVDSTMTLMMRCDLLDSLFICRTVNLDY